MHRILLLLIVHHSLTAYTYTPHTHARTLNTYTLIPHIYTADIGLALLAGHANSNTTDSLSAPTLPPTAGAVEKGEKGGTTDLTTPNTTPCGTGGAVLTAEDSLNAHEQALKLRGSCI